MIAATIATILIITILCTFQILLAYGKPFGEFAWGGQHKVLPKKLRVASILSIFIYLAIAVCLVSKSGLYQIIPKGKLLDTLVWIILAYFILGIFLNAISPNKSERYTMTPIAIILAICVLIIAIT
jgi:hypothetical protein